MLDCLKLGLRRGAESPWIRRRIGGPQGTPWPPTEQNILDFMQFFLEIVVKLYAGTPL